ncbi:MAG: hypothetical protein MJE68_12080 [Proteobacteria bacterium]|nr:hypothetical protein [Pseudomonadota bacterium]
MYAIALIMPLSPPSFPSLPLSLSLPPSLSPLSQKLPLFLSLLYNNIC